MQDILDEVGPDSPVVEEPAESPYWALTPAELAVIEEFQKSCEAPEVIHERYEGGGQAFYSYLHLCPENK
jgi:hypothetical protein